MDTEKLVTISHDPFARVEVVRRKLDDFEKPSECQWCGQPAKFEYGSWSDGYGASPNMDGVAFCSVECRKPYFS